MARGKGVGAGAVAIGAVGKGTAGKSCNRQAGAVPSSIPCSSSVIYCSRNIWRSPHSPASSFVQSDDVGFSGLPSVTVKDGRH